MQETMGQIIKKLRKERNFTQEELAEQLGVTFQAVSKWENDSGMPGVTRRSGDKRKCILFCF